MTETLENVQTRGDREEPLLSVRDLRVTFTRQGEKPTRTDSSSPTPAGGSSESRTSCATAGVPSCVAPALWRRGPTEGRARERG